jgi:hypothetical protein
MIINSYTTRGVYHPLLSQLWMQHVSACHAALLPLGLWTNGGRE